MYKDKSSGDRLSNLKSLNLKEALDSPTPFIDIYSRAKSPRVIRKIFSLTPRLVNKSIRKLNTLTLGSNRIVYTQITACFGDLFTGTKSSGHTYLMVQTVQKYGKFIDPVQRVQKMFVCVQDAR